jgi:hypothetical protein
MLQLIKLPQAWIAALHLVKAIRTSGDKAAALASLRAALALDRHDLQQWLAADLPRYVHVLGLVYQLLTDVTAADSGAADPVKLSADALALLREGIEGAMQAHPGEFSYRHAQEVLNG